MLTKTERAVIETLRKRLSDAHIAACGFRRDDGRERANDAAEIERATRIWRNSWILPALDALLGEFEQHGYLSRNQALRDMGKI